MAYTDDWESLMNGVFGPGGKLKFSQSTPQAAQPKPEKPEKTQDGPLPDWNAALLARQKKLDCFRSTVSLRLTTQSIPATAPARLRSCAHYVVQRTALSSLV